jgi:hypothetical protein
MACIVCAAASLFIGRGCSPKCVQALLGDLIIQVTFDTLAPVFHHTMATNSP